MEQFYSGIAEILEVEQDRVSPALVLADYAWDSLAIVSTIALVDEVFDKMLDGQALGRCETVGDILALIQPAG